MDLPFTISDMTIDDLQDVMVLEERCFPTPWSINAYRREIEYNPRSHYIVLHGRRDLLPALPALLGYGGFWELGEEAHIVTIAISPAWQRNKLGEVLLLIMIGRARALGVRDVALEVREHNDAAQKLYEGLGFVRVGRRRGYYPATPTRPREDALLLTLSGIDQDAVYSPLLVRYEQAATTATRRLLVG